MSQFRLTTVLLTLVLLHGFLAYVCQSCSVPDGWTPPTLVDKIIRAHSVFYGRVRETYPDERISTAYTVELEVYCILKGKATPLVINVTGAGWIPGHCESSEYLPGHDYIVRAYEWLSISGGDINATKENLNGITKACGLNPVTRPTGSASTVQCPVSASKCQREATNIKPFQPVFGDEHIVELIEPTFEIYLDDKSSASATIATVAMTTLAATAAAALVLSKIMK